MIFNSFSYLVFLPVVAVLYFIFPAKIRWLWLLLASYYFYMSWNGKYAVLLLFSTFVTYLSGLALQKVAKKYAQSPRLRRYKNLVVAFSFTINLAILVFFKYFGFLSSLLEKGLSLFSIGFTAPDFQVLLPVGISFYTFQALSYTMDVYRGAIPAQWHFGKYALFVSFFPQLVAGPIERSENLLPQFDQVKKFSWANLTSGLVQIGWGFFKKIVIADRVAIFVNGVYNYPDMHQGFTVAIATVFFAVQIYCDFAGYSDIAIGSARILGYDLMTNFRTPYFSKSIAEFWRRWHISLSTWFRDYLYIPLGGNRVPTLRRYFNIMVVFLTSGLWHGASLNFLVWGGLHGAYQVVGQCTGPLRKKITTRLGADTSGFGWRFGQALCTFALTCFGWIFFRANGLSEALVLVKNLFVFNYWVFMDDSLLALGLDGKELAVALVSIAILLGVEWAGRRRDMAGWLARQNIIFRWGVYFFVIFWILLFGVYGTQYPQESFIYFQF